MRDSPVLASLSDSTTFCALPPPLPLRGIIKPTPRSYKVDNTCPLVPGINPFLFIYCQIKVLFVRSNRCGGVEYGWGRNDSDPDVERGPGDRPDLGVFYQGT